MIIIPILQMEKLRLSEVKLPKIVHLVNGSAWVKLWLVANSEPLHSDLFH